MNKWIRKLLWCLSLAASARLICVPVGAWQEGPQEGNKMMRQSAVPASVIEGEIASCSASVAVGNPLLCLEAEELEGLTLTPGGMPFGVRFLTDGVTVVGFCDFEAGGKKVNPAAAAGLKLRDTILRVNGEPLTGASALTEKIEHCGGRELILLCRRGASEMELRLKPVWCEAEQRYKTGIWVRDSGAGIGTVTFIIPETGAFAGLGHGICDADSGELIAMRRGTVSDVTISSVVRGAVGAPGELKGYFNPGKTGALLGNSACGVWGVFSDPPESTADALPVGLRGELEEGSAEIFCTLDSNRIGRYRVEISNIDRTATGSKCFSVKITDPALIAASGGIVQGMSGSPIVQNGKLVGAVTHVLINDPTAGYGIFLENMLLSMPLAVH
ncbi:MAG: SpoIVB peptidase [Eubacteriales bacterium]|nr:SpoIVB peptidase [Eubacteriales bacterium]